MPFESIGEHMKIKKSLIIVTSLYLLHFSNPAMAWGKIGGDLAGAFDKIIKAPVPFVTGMVTAGANLVTFNQCENYAAKRRDEYRSIEQQRVAEYRQSEEKRFAEESRKLKQQEISQRIKPLEQQRVSFQFQIDRLQFAQKNLQVFGQFVDIVIEFKNSDLELPQIVATSTKSQEISKDLESVDWSSPLQVVNLALKQNFSNIQEAKSSLTQALDSLNADKLAAISLSIQQNRKQKEMQLLAAQVKQKVIERQIQYLSLLKEKL